MQFDELVLEPVSEAPLFDCYEGNRYMRYHTTETSNPQIKNGYPLMYALFEKNNTLCARYLNDLFSNEMKYVSAGHNFLVNNGWVIEQGMHTDYDGMDYKVTTTNN